MLGDEPAQQRLTLAARAIRSAAPTGVRTSRPESCTRVTGWLTVLVVTPSTSVSSCCTTWESVLEHQHLVLRPAQAVATQPLSAHESDLVHPAHELGVEVRDLDGRWTRLTG